MEKTKIYLGVTAVLLVLFIAVLFTVALPTGEFKMSSSRSLDSSAGVSSCVDTDGGINYDTFGVCTARGKDYVDSCKRGRLTEYYCSGSRCASTSTTCSYLCDSGRCTYECYDSDGGNEKTIYGYVTYGNETTYDYCLSENTICELVCLLGSPACVADTSCPGDYMCANGVCTESNATHTECDSGYCITVNGSGTSECDVDNDCRHKECVNLTCETLMSPGSDECTTNDDCTYCNDTDGGINIYVKGTCYDDIGGYEDYCNNNGYLAEYYCNYSEGNVCTNNTDSCPSNYYCNDGACVEEPEIWCNDSDGQNYLVKGYVNSSAGYFEDMCNYSDDVLKEYVCLYNAPVAYVISCSEQFGSNYYCEDGACVEEEIICTDSDGGKVYDVAGICINSSYGSNDTFYDTCMDITLLKEYHCDEIPKCQAIFYTCNLSAGHYCEEGACIPDNGTA